VSHTPRRVTQNWAYFDPVAYLDEYYADLGGENLALLRFLAVTVARQLPAGDALDCLGWRGLGRSMRVESGVRDCVYQV